MEYYFAAFADCLGLGTGSIMIANTINHILTPKINKHIISWGFMSVNVIMHILTFYVDISTEFLPNIVAVMNVKTLFTILSFMGLFFLMYKDKLKEKVKVFLVFLVFDVFFEAVLSIFIQNILGKNIIEIYRGNFVESTVMGASFVTIYALVSISTYAFCKRSNLKVPKSILVLLGLASLLLCIAISIAANIVIESKNKVVGIAYLFIPIVFMLIFIANYYIMVKLSEKEKLKEKLYWMENLKLVNMTYYEDVQKKYDEIRKFRHDVKDNLQLLDSLIKSGDSESVKKAEILLDSYNSQVEDSKIKHFTDNVVVNTIAMNEAENAEKLGVSFKAEINIPGEINNIELIDINCAYLNIIRNAVEAADRVSSTQPKFVDVHSSVKSGFLFIKTINSYDCIKHNKGKIETTKLDKSKHGIGISLIEEIAKKYDGSFKMDFEDNVCTATLALKI